MSNNSASSDDSSERAIPKGVEGTPYLGSLDWNRNMDAGFASDILERRKRGMPVVAVLFAKRSRRACKSHRKTTGPFTAKHAAWRPRVSHRKRLTFISDVCACETPVTAHPVILLTPVAQHEGALTGSIESVT